MLILIAHGSRNADWRASVEDLAESVQARLEGDELALAYMQYTGPTLMDVALEAIRTGATRIRVLPLFLTGQGHVQRTVGPLVNEVARAHPTVDIELLPPVGQHPLFADLLSKIAEEEGD